jgi:AcrR family transcriptional regulator
MPDPERSTELLWGTTSRRALSLERIVLAAIELADAEGLAAVSMRRVAERLGFTTMSLYRHVPGKAELVDLMRDEALREGSSPGAERRSGWRAELEAWAREGLVVYRTHPWLAELTGSRQIPGPHAVAAFERALAIVAQTGLRPAQVVAVVTLVGGFVESAARQAAETSETERRSGVTEEEWWGARGSLFDRLGPYPTIGQIWESGGYDQPEDPFEFGLQRVLDGIGTLVELRGGTRDETSDGTTSPGCAVCGRVVDRAATGRPRAYCSRACRQRAYRARKAAGA